LGNKVFSRALVLLIPAEKFAGLDRARRRGRIDQANSRRLAAVT